jgi:protein-S-isoprenylcysteine O-methyltransferase Ste14
MTKPRVQLDAFIIGAFMIVTAIGVAKCPRLFLEGPGVRDLCDVAGFFLIIVGALLRMSGRGFKKQASAQGGALVTDGPYKFVRNPMYLGTFLIGVGFMFPLFPLWTIPVFAFVFYSRFKIQIRLEEEWLRKNFGQSYEDYCRRVPAFIPTAKSFQNAGLYDIFSPPYLWTTKEMYGLFYWPLLSTILELLEESVLWGRMSLTPVWINATIAAVFLSVVLKAKKS